MLDPFEDAEALNELGNRITTLAAHIAAATHEMLLLIADFDRRRGWELEGHRSCAHWLHVRTGMDLGTAREKVRTARALVGLPETSASMARGKLSFSAVRAITRVATPENEGELLEVAQEATTAELERTVRAWRVHDRRDEVELERQRRLSRKLSVFPDNEGMYVIHGRLPPEVGVLVQRAVEAASDTIFRETRPTFNPKTSREEAARRRADALGLIAERALAAGFGPRPGRRGKEDGRVESNATAAAGEGASPNAEGRDQEEGTLDETDGGSCTCSHSRVPISGSKAERYQVVIHIDPATLDAQAEPGMAELEDGTRVSAETARRLACDCSLVLMSRDADGSPLDVGRKTRTISPALRRALNARDKGCRFPGCNVRLSSGHHLRHWADGGETSLENCVLLCGSHHYLVHEGGWSVEWLDQGQPVFRNPRGDSLFEGMWDPPEIGDMPVEDLVNRNRARGVEV